MSRDCTKYIKNIMRNSEREGGSDRHPTAIGYPPTAIGYPPTAIGYHPTIELSLMDASSAFSPSSLGLHRVTHLNLVQGWIRTARRPQEGLRRADLVSSRRPCPAMLHGGGRAGWRVGSPCRWPCNGPLVY